MLPYQGHLVDPIRDAMRYIHSRGWFAIQSRSGTWQFAFLRRFIRYITRGEYELASFPRKLNRIFVTDANVAYTRDQVQNKTDSRIADLAILTPARLPFTVTICAAWLTYGLAITTTKTPSALQTRSTDWLLSASVHRPCVVQLGIEVGRRRRWGLTWGDFDKGYSFCQISVHHMLKCGCGDLGPDD